VNTIMMICEIIVGNIRMNRTVKWALEDDIGVVQFWVNSTNWFFEENTLIMVWGGGGIVVEDGLLTLPNSIVCPSCLGLDRLCDWQTTFQCEPF